MKQPTLDALRRFLEKSNQTTYIFRLTRTEAAGVLALVEEVEQLRESLRQAHEVIDQWAQGNKNFQTDNEHLRAELAAERERAAKIALSLDFSELRDEEKIPAGRASRIIADAIRKSET